MPPLDADTGNLFRHEKGFQFGNWNVTDDFAQVALPPRCRRRPCARACTPDPRGY
jgi:hypothetical protein